VIPEGTYLARVVKGELGETKKGAVQAAIEFEFEDEAVRGQRITSYKHFTDKALKYTVAELRTCGHTGDDLSDLSMLGGQEVRLVIAHETYEGKTSAKVKFINSASGGLKSKLEPDRAKTWAETMKAKVAAIDAGGDPRPDAPHDSEMEPPPF
jgi:hypothetical protein